MADLKDLYESGKLTELLAACKDSDGGFEGLMYSCLGQIGSHNFEAPTLEAAKTVFEQAMAAGNDEQKRELLAKYIPALKTAAAKCIEIFGKGAPTKNSVVSYRDSMEFTADGLIEAAKALKDSNPELALEAGKAAAQNLCEVAKVREYDNDNGKSVTHRVDNIVPERRAVVLPKFDEITALCKELDPSYIAEEIQREHLIPGQKEKEEQKVQDAAAGKKKSFLDKLLDLF